MKRPPLSETDFDHMTPDALDPNGVGDEHAESDWPAWALGSGVACVVVSILTFLNFQFADVIFKGHSAKLAQNINYFLIAMAIGFGLYCAYASVKAYTIKNKGA